VQTDAPQAPAATPLKLVMPTGGVGWKGRLKALAARAVPAGLLVKRGAPGAPRVALTFDDGPHEMTDAYLDILDRFGARVTFFVVGREAEKDPEALLRIIARGHEVAGHGFTHTAFTSLGPGALRDELARTAALLPPAATPRPLVRPPFGATSLVSLAVSAQAGYTTVMWSRDSDDCRTSSSAEVAARLAPDTLVPGDIVLLHEAQEWTLAALPRVLGALTAAGWQAVTVGEILEPPRP
jgi:peptidoglycan-N-acetylglucosamine deacetylase